MERDEVLYYLDKIDEETNYLPCGSRYHDALHIAKNAVIETMLDDAKPEDNVVPVENDEEENEYRTIRICCMDGSIEIFNCAKYERDWRMLTVFCNGTVRTYPLKNIKWFEVYKEN